MTQLGDALGKALQEWKGQDKSKKEALVRARCPQSLKDEFDRLYPEHGALSKLIIAAMEAALTASKVGALFINEPRTTKELPTNKSGTQPEGKNKGILPKGRKKRKR